MSDSGREGGVALLEILDNAERVQVVVEREPVLTHGGVESFFASVAKGRMADIMHERECFHEIDIEAERAGDGARNLRDFERVREAIAEMIAVSAREDLRLGFEAAERAGVNHTVAVALEIVAVGMRRLRKAASAGVLDVHRVAGQHKGSVAEQQFPVSSSRSSTIECHRVEGLERARLSGAPLKSPTNPDF